MTLSTEATIALFALFIACVPGNQFIVNQKSQIREWWNRTRGHLSSTNSIHFYQCMPICTEHHWEPADDGRPDSSQDHDLLSLPIHLTNLSSSSPDPPHSANLFGLLFSSLQPRYSLSNSGISPTALEAGLLLFTRVRHRVHTEPT